MLLRVLHVYFVLSGILGLWTSNLCFKLLPPVLGKCMWLMFIAKMRLCVWNYDFLWRHLSGKIVTVLQTASGGFCFNTASHFCLFWDLGLVRDYCVLRPSDCQFYLSFCISFYVYLCNIRSSFVLWHIKICVRKFSESGW